MHVFHRFSSVMILAFVFSVVSINEASAYFPSESVSEVSEETGRVNSNDTKLEVPINGRELYYEIYAYLKRHNDAGKGEAIIIDRDELPLEVWVELEDELKGDHKVAIELVEFGTPVKLGYMFSLIRE